MSALSEVQSEDEYDSDGCKIDIHGAVENNNLEKVKQLLSCGANVNERDSYNCTPLHFVAIRNRNDYFYDMAEILLKNGADVNARDNKGQTPLYNLVEYANVRIIKLFLNFKANIHEVSATGMNLLFKAVGFNHEVVQFLIDLGINVHHQCNKKRTPLHWACCSLSEDNKIMKCLLKNGAEMDAVDEEGCTSLILASRSFSGILNKTSLRKNHLKFILEHSDVNKLNLKQEHILTFLGQFNTFNLWILVLKHLAKLQTLDILIHPVILKAISKNEEFNKHYEKCMEELLKAKDSRLPNCWITFYNLLVDSRRKLKNYVGNRDMLEAFNNSDYKKEFPYYQAYMNKNVHNGVRRRVLFDKSVDLLSNCLPCFNPTHIIINDILDCIMSKKDLSKFCE